MEFIERCYDIKCFLQLGSYQLHDFDDGAYSDFQVPKIENMQGLLDVIGSLENRFFVDSGYINVRVFEDFKDY